MSSLTRSGSSSSTSEGVSPGGEQVQYVTDANPHAPNAGLPSALLRANRNSFKDFRHLALPGTYSLVGWNIASSFGWRLLGSDQHCT